MERAPRRRRGGAVGEGSDLYLQEKPEKSPRKFTLRLSSTSGTVVLLSPFSSTQNHPPALPSGPQLSRTEQLRRPKPAPRIHGNTCAHLCEHRHLLDTNDKNKKKMCSNIRLVNSVLYSYKEMKNSTTAIMILQLARD